MKNPKHQRQAVSAAIDAARGAVDKLPRMKLVVSPAILKGIELAAAKTRKVPNVNDPASRVSIYGRNSGDVMVHVNAAWTGNQWELCDYERFKDIFSDRA